MIDIKDFVLPAPASVSLSDSSTYVTTRRLDNPVSLFNASRLEIVRASNIQIMDSYPMIGRLLLVGAVSSFESYCRGILSGCLSICPMSQAKSSDKSINLGGALWHGARSNFNRSAFDHKSLADVKELRTTFREYIDFDIGTPIFSDLMSSFDRIMQLRHAVVHADGIVPGRNAVKLELRRSRDGLVVKIGQREIQECLLVISTLVSTLNRELFDQMCRRWALDWRRRADWDPVDERRILNRVYELFVDKGYNRSLGSARRWGKDALKAAVVAQYNLAE